MSRRKSKEVTHEELQAAWDVVADYMNQHHELCFFIDPWTKRRAKRYTLHFIDNYDKYISVVRASRSWNK